MQVEVEASVDVHFVFLRLNLKPIYNTLVDSTTEFNIHLFLKLQN